MSVFIVAIPLFDSEMSVQAYRLCDQSGDTMLGVGKDFRRMNDALTSHAFELVNEIGIDPFTNGQPLFIDITAFQLLAGMLDDMHIDPEKLVAVLPSDTAPDEAILAQCKKVKEMGAGIAMADFPRAGVECPIVEHLDYVILDFLESSYTMNLKAMRERAPHVRPIVSSIPDMNTYQLLGRNRGMLFTGQFYSQPITRGTSILSPVKVNALHLLNQVNQEDFDLLDIVRIIERDPYLTISLLRFINSGDASFSRQIESIKSAVAILGQKQVRRWATVSLSVNLMDDKPSEITKLSLVRAKFAENLAGAFELGVFQSGLFMTGLFSLLDVILDQPMDQAIRQVAVNNQVQQALVQKKGDFNKVMELIYAYEHADWDQCTIIMIKNDIKIETLNQAFIDALLYYNQLLNAVEEDRKEHDEAEQTQPV